MLQKVASDDIPDMIDSVRWHYRQFLSSIKTRKHEVKKRTINLVNLVCESYRIFFESLKPCSNFLRYLKTEGLLDLPIQIGKFGSRTKEIRDRLRLGRLRGIKASDTLTRWFPGFMEDCRHLEKKLQLKRHVAIEWLTDGVTLDYAHELNSSTIEPLTAMLAKIAVRFWGQVSSPESSTVFWNIISRRIRLFQHLTSKKNFSFRTNF